MVEFLSIRERKNFLMNTQCEFRNSGEGAQNRINLE
jgi:hypothetical protein